MIETALRILSVTFWCFFVSNKIVLEEKKPGSVKTSYIVLPCALVIVFLADMISPSLTLLALLGILCLYIRMRYDIKLRIVFTYSVICLSVNFAVYCISMIIVAFAASVLFFLGVELGIVVYELIIFFMHAGLILLIFRIRKFARGLYILKNKELTVLNFVISAGLVLLYTIVVDTKSADSTFLISILGLLLLTILIFIVWDKGLRKIYFDHLRIQEIESLALQIIEKDKYIKKLETSNEELASIIHRDNKALPALSLSVANFISSDINIQQIESGRELISNIQDVLQERENLLSRCKTGEKQLPTSDITSLDSMLQYMLTCAERDNIDFSVIFYGEIKNIIKMYMTETELRTIVADLVENSIIAARPIEGKKILLEIGIKSKHYCINIFDNGIPFEMDVYDNFGIKKTTTHASSGGSGIGIMSTVELARKYKASIVITEYNPLDLDYTKNISIIFDEENSFKISSYRHKMLKTHLNRDDILLTTV